MHFIPGCETSASLRNLDEVCRCARTTGNQAYSCVRNQQTYTHHNPPGKNRLTTRPAVQPPHTYDLTLPVRNQIYIYTIVYNSYNPMQHHASTLHLSFYRRRVLNHEFSSDFVVGGDGGWWRCTRTGQDRAGQDSSCKCGSGEVCV